jgi:hypothetical protein
MNPCVITNSVTNGVKGMTEMEYAIIVNYGITETNPRKKSTRLKSDMPSKIK